MADIYRQDKFKFADAGLQLRLPVDLIPRGQYAKLTNALPIIEGRLQTRAGQSAIVSFAPEATYPGSGAHSIIRVNQGALAAVGDRVVGLDTDIYTLALPAGNTPVLRTSGGNPTNNDTLSGNPLSQLTFRFDQDQAVWDIIADRERMFKYRGGTGSGYFQQLGIDPPTFPLVASVGGGGNLTGDYDWRFTYVNIVTGSESNPSPVNWDSGQTETKRPATITSPDPGFGGSAFDATNVGPPVSATGTATTSPETRQSILLKDFAASTYLYQELYLNIPFTMTVNGVIAPRLGTVFGTIYYSLDGGNTWKTMIDSSVGIIPLSVQQSLRLPPSQDLTKLQVRIVVLGVGNTFSPQNVIARRIRERAGNFDLSGILVGAGGNSTITFNLGDVTTLGVKSDATVDDLTLAAQEAVLTIPAPTDPQVTHVRIYRRGGSLPDNWYLDQQVPITDIDTDLSYSVIEDFDADSGFSYTNVTAHSAVGVVNTTIPAGVGSTGIQTVTPGSMSEIRTGSLLIINGADPVGVVSTTAATFTADFPFTYGAGVAVNDSALSVTITDQAFAGVVDWTVALDLSTPGGSGTSPDDVFTYWLYLNASSDAQAFFVFYNSAGGFYYSFLYNPAGLGYSAGWNLIRLRRSQFFASGSPDWTAITAMQTQVQLTAASISATYYQNGFYLSDAGALGIIDDVLDTELGDAIELTNDVPVTSVFVQGRRLPFIWGPFTGGGSPRWLGCGDPDRPGAVYFSNAGNADECGSPNWLDVSTPSDSMQNGCVYNSRCYGFSHERLWELTPNILGGATFTAYATPCARGLISPWAFCVADLIYFVAKDGVYATSGDAQVSLVEDSIKPLFPTLDSPAQDVQGYEAIDMERIEDIRLRYYNYEIYFIYRGALSDQLQCLIFDTLRKRWRAAVYNDDPVAEAYSEDATISSLLFGTESGRLLTTHDGPDVSADPEVVIITGAHDQHEPLNEKEYGSVLFDLDPGGATDLLPVTITPLLNAQEITESAIVVIGTGRQQIPLTLGDIYGFNISFKIQWTRTAVINPVLYQYNILYRVEPVRVRHFEVRETSLGQPGFQHMRDMYVALRSTDVVTLTLTFDNDYVQTYAIPSTGDLRQKVYVPLHSNKFKEVHIEFDSDEDFRLYISDSEVRCKPWLTNLGYTIRKPFGADSGIMPSLDPGDSE